MMVLFVLLFPNCTRSASFLQHNHRAFTFPILPAKINHRCEEHAECKTHTFEEAGATPYVARNLPERFAFLVLFRFLRLLLLQSGQTKQVHRISQLLWRDRWRFLFL